MAVSVNPKRLSDPAKVEKWFGRNCRWTLGRDCTPQEKADFVALHPEQVSVSARAETHRRLGAKPDRAGVGDRRPARFETSDRQRLQT